MPGGPGVSAVAPGPGWPEAPQIIGAPFIPARRFNNFEGGTNGTAITAGAAGNGGGISGDPWDIVTIGTSATVQFDSTHVAHGSMACQIATGGTAATAILRWTNNTMLPLFGVTWAPMWFRFYLYSGATPTGNNYRLLGFFDTSGTICGQLRYNTTGFLQLTNASSAALTSGVVAVPLNQWVRIEGFISPGANGVAQAFLYSTNPEGTTPDDTIGQFTSNFGNPIGAVTMGQSAGAITGYGPLWFDEFVISNTGPVGPYVPPGPVYGVAAGLYTAGTAFPVQKTTAQGDGIVVAADASSSPTSIADSQGNTYIQVRNAGGNAVWAATYKGSPGVATSPLTVGTDTVTITGGGATGALIVAGVQGIAPQAIDTSATNSFFTGGTGVGPGLAAPATGTMTGRDIVVGVFQSGTNLASLAPLYTPSGFTLVANQTGGGGGQVLGYQVAPSTGTITPQVLVDGTVNGGNGTTIAFLTGVALPVLPVPLVRTRPAFKGQPFLVSRTRYAALPPNQVAAVTQQWLQQTFAHRQLRTAAQPHGRAFAPPAGQPDMAPPGPHERVRPPLRRQGRIVQPVQAQQQGAVPPPWPPPNHLLLQVLRRGLPRRGRAVVPVPPQELPLVHLPWRRLGLPRRGRAITPVPPQLNPPKVPDYTHPSRVRFIRQAWRGRVWQPVQTQAAAGPPPYPVPNGLERILQRGLLRVVRGRVYQPVQPQQQGAVPPPWPPDRPHVRARLIPARRAALRAPVPPQDAPGPIVRARLRQPWRRPGRAGQVVFQPPAPPARQRPPARRPPPRRKAAVQMPPAVQAFTGPPYPPERPKSRLRTFLQWLRRGRRFEPGWGQAVPPTIPTGTVWSVCTAAPRWHAEAAATAWWPEVASHIWSSEAVAAHWSALPARLDWRTAMPTPVTLSTRIFEPIAAISNELVNALWTSDLGGVVTDPTVLPMPVQFAFPVSSGNLLAPAEPVTWFTGAWAASTGAYRGYIAQIMIGPSIGVVTLTAGQTYDVWSWVNTGAGQENPKKFVGQLPVY